MEFDRTGPEGGIEIYTSINSGKALLECKVHLRKTTAELFLEETEGTSYIRQRETCLDIRVWDREGKLVLNCRHPLWQEELAKGLILHPHLWQGMEDPYLYRLQALLIEKEDCITDVLENTLALRTFREVPGKGWFLNDRLYPVKPVAYAVSDVMGNRKARETEFRRDMELIRSMGANTVCLTGGEINRELCQVCDEMGMLLWWQEKKEHTVWQFTQEAIIGKKDEEFLDQEGWNTRKRDSQRKDTEQAYLAIQEVGISNSIRKEIKRSNPEEGTEIPRFYGTGDSLLTLRSRMPTERYYYYKACWSSEPFVYISADSLHFKRNGNAEITVYSNQKKVALYVEGILFEFQSEGPEFRFQEIPVKKLPMMLTAETGECSMSVTAYPFTQFSQNNHFSMTFSAYNGLTEGDRIVTVHSVTGN